MNFSFHPEADQEFIEAAAYYEDCEPGVGIDFSREVFASIQNALDYPTISSRKAYSSSPSCTCTAIRTTGNTDTERAEPAPERYGFASR